MMRLVDTSAWIEWLVDTKVGRTLVRELPKREEWLVPTIVQLELSKWMVRETDEERTDQVIAFTHLCVIAPLDTKLALEAAHISRTLKLSTADAIVYATARQFGAEIVTCDAHFRDLEGVIYIPKSNI